MPDVTRTDSQRSDISLRPRVSFNRDVHVKRIVSDSGTRVSGSALSGDGAGHLVALPVRRERLGRRTKQELAVEAAKILQQVDNLDCTSNHTGIFPEKYYSLPNRRKHRIIDSPQNSIDRKTQRRKSDELGLNQQPPRKPPRTFASNVTNEPNKSSTKVRRSVSDATNLKSKAFRPSNDVKTLRKRSGSESEDTFGHAKGKKAQLSPIIEQTQREDYFERNSQQDKENRNVERVEVVKKNVATPPHEESVTEKLKEYIDEIDSVLYKDSGYKPKREKKPPEVVVIDVDKAEKISTKKDTGKKKFNTAAIGRKLKSITTKKKPDAGVTTAAKTLPVKKPAPRVTPTTAVKEAKAAPKIKKAIENLATKTDSSPKMIHSSQKPPEKLPLTRGRAVDTMVKRLNNDKFSPPPKATVIIAPNVSVQHNNNQPFSYTRGLSPERLYQSPTDGSRSPRYDGEPGSPVIYAQVVCGNGGPDNGPTKQTIHTTYTNGKKHLPHSDSDEGLGCEENSGFSRTKYDAEKILTHFGDDVYHHQEKRNENEEYPITPKFKNFDRYTNGYGYNNEFSKTEHSIFIDSSSRGRGDGMDARRRESLTEPHENGFAANGRSDLSHRRDLLESRINSRRLGAAPVQNGNNKYVTETTSHYYKHGSASPVGYTDKYTSETKTDRHGERYTTEQRSRTNHADPGPKNQSTVFDVRYKTTTSPIRYEQRYDNEPKSFDSQLSDYRSSPENGNVRRFETSHDYKTTNKYKSRSDKHHQQQIIKDRDHYKSNPEIHPQQNGYDINGVGGRYQETYHDSLRRQKNETTSATSPKRYFDQNENERKDKFGDSGIENDFRRDSGERRPPRHRTNREFCNESEDEGFASSLLIASERQHTEENVNGSRKARRNGYDSDRGYLPRDDRDEMYRHNETMEYKHRSSKERDDVYAHRERSIDDGSHYDPRIDKDLERERSATLKSKGTDKKPPKPEKKSSLEKVKQLFTRDSSKKKREKEAAKGMVREESLRARYSEYRGSREALEPRVTRREGGEAQSSYGYTNRRRLSTPSPSPTRQNDAQRNGKTEVSHSSWFKSLDRLSRKKNKKIEKESNLTSTEEEVTKPPPPTKNLRFFGDTDVESNSSVRRKSALKTRQTPTTSARSQSTRDLHNISEESLQKISGTNNRSMQNINETSSKINLKPPMSPNRRGDKDAPRRGDDKGRTTRRRNEVSSVESSTEGDSSQQSQRSVVYLHAATVGDIPGPGYLRNGRRAASREELTSNTSSRIQPQVKTLSRSFSVLAPWKPRHYRESMDIDYTQYPKPIKNGKYEQRSTKSNIRRKEDASTLKKKVAETRKSNQNVSTLNRNAKSKENLSSQTLNRRSTTKDDLTKGSSSTLYKKRDRPSKENSRYTRSGDDKKISSKSMSVESLGGNRNSARKSREPPREISRSVSMPRDPEKSAGWFGLSKKSSKVKSRSMQRL